MNRNHAIVALCCLVVALSACGERSSQDLIVGKWKAGQGGIKVEAEFAKDGTAKLTMFEQTLRGTYKLDGDELEWTLNGRTTKHKVKVSATELEVTGDDKTVLVYQRQ